MYSGLGPDILCLGPAGLLAKSIVEPMLNHCYNVLMKLRFEPTIPNYLTLLRLLAIPFLAWAIAAGERYQTMAFVFFVCIWFTDMLDGYIARHFNQMSDFGKVFDPFVDKVFQFTTAVMMYLTHRLPLWVPIFIFSKEIMMIVGGYIMLRRWKIVVKSLWYGKVSTVLFVAAFAALFFIDPYQTRLAGYLFSVPVTWSVLAYVLYGLRFLYLIFKKKADQK